MNTKNLTSALIFCSALVCCSSIGYSQASAAGAPPPPIVHGCPPPSVAATPVRDEEAVRILKDAVAAMGGTALANQTLRFTISGRIDTPNSEATGKFRLKEDHSVTPSTFSFEMTQGGQHRISNSKTMESSFERQLSAGGHRLTSITPTLFPLANFIAALASPTTSIRQVPLSLARVRFPNEILIQIEDSKPDDEVARIQTWYLDTGTHLPRYVADYVPLEKTCSLQVRAFDVFQAAPEGFLVPMRSKVRTLNGTEEVLVVDRISMGGNE